MPLRKNTLHLDALTADPGSLVNGDLWYRSDDEILKLRTGGATQVVGRRDNLSATRSPNVGDDVTDGYEPGSLWIDTTGNVVWICMINTASGAEWKPLTRVSGSVNSTGSNTRSNTTYSSLSGQPGTLLLPVVGRYIITLEATFNHQSSNGRVYMAVGHPQTAALISSSEVELKRGNNSNDLQGSLQTQAAVSITATGAGVLVRLLNRTDSGTFTITDSRGSYLLYGSN